MIEQFTNSISIAGILFVLFMFGFLYLIGQVISSLRLKRIADDYEFSPFFSAIMVMIGIFSFIINVFPFWFFFASLFVYLILSLKIRPTLKKENPIRMFYVPSGRKSKAVYLHFIALTTGILIVVAKVISFPIFLILTYMGYTGSMEKISSTTIVLVIIYLFTLVINKYKDPIRKKVSQTTGMKVR